jgi:hypothetical protein
MGLPHPPESCTVQTPALLAIAMARAININPNASWLDPCVGNGVFIKALYDEGIGKESITAIDIENNPSDNDKYAMTLRGIDFLDWVQQENGAWDNIICNPPYAAIEKLAPVLQKSATAVNLPDGILINLNSNYWCSFIVACLKILKKGGSISFVLPAAWDYADYAKPLREKIPKLFESFFVYRSRKPLFETVLDGNIIIIGYGYGLPNVSQYRCEFDSISDLVQNLSSVSIKDRSISCDVEHPKKYTSHPFTCTLGEIIDIHLGGVTGDSKYFLLSERERLKFNLPLESLEKVISKAKHLVSSEISVEEWKHLLEQNERVWLFRPNGDIANRQEVLDYLELDPDDGGCNRTRLKIRGRNPWYVTPLPKHVDGFMSGMSKFGPWITITTDSNISANNTLYIIRFKQQLSLKEKCAWAFSLLTSYSRRIARTFGRNYPGGLLKYELGDIKRIPVLIPPEREDPREEYKRAVDLLLNGKAHESQTIADNWFNHYI